MCVEPSKSAHFRLFTVVLGHFYQCYHQLMFSILRQKTFSDVRMMLLLSESRNI